jgi:hypothetical protein
MSKCGDAVMRVGRRPSRPSPGLVMKKGFAITWSDCVVLWVVNFSRSGRANRWIGRSSGGCVPQDRGEELDRQAKQARR